MALVEPTRQTPSSPSSSPSTPIYLLLLLSPSINPYDVHSPTLSPPSTLLPRPMGSRAIPVAGTRIR